ncbi:hypothetical protein [Pseudoalteromonas peptidolytica]|uniref:Sulfotransferase domain-containing protein n=1 Tax=Pseudoalteromonas peptidolytica F12-50-A1 TaxID=1315280 RepID=A0A8I0MXG9_9GAMM|nr:hypothetical protein [Pseudoalteromonas peptidolytica]MBE0347288.1 hypothetical protein [Pseudoalteromonas peptidolytica F12-50-A1]NLR13924.1 hypothetical protein [Pseudoalteromonas peptidolytica]GEK08872.1 hypothetical protein PPE03_11210 [Pseudoalteromonas peptidolytica]
MLKQLVKSLASQLGYHITVTPITNTPVAKRAAYIHIGKCGGSAIDNALRKALATPEDARLCRDTSIAASMTNFGQALDSLDSQCRFSEHHLIQLQGLLRYFLSLERHYVSGHWGVNHDILSTYRDVHFITMLRDPIARLKSNYIFNKLTNNLPVMPPNNFSNDDLIAEANTILFSTRGWQMANTQSAFICGRYPATPDEAKAQHTRFIENLACFGLVGFLDNLNAFSDKFTQQFNRPLDIKVHNATESQISHETQKVVDTLQEYFRSKEIKTHLAKLCEQELKNIDVARERFG